MFDYVVVGCGLSGAVMAERIANDFGKRVLMIDRRSHVGGNCYDSYNEYGLLIHNYGPHWFHTSSDRIFSYLSQFTGWLFHYHRVKTYVGGRLLTFPINVDTINELYNLNLSVGAEFESYLDSVRDKSLSNPRNAEEMVVSQVGRDLYEQFFKGYTEKQWGVKPTELSKSITARIPIRNSRDNRYFSDKYQGVPKHGYTAMFNRMLESKNISVLLGTDYLAIRDSGLLASAKKIIYTGPIDEYFKYSLGKLDYRSLRFEYETIRCNLYQEVQQINFPNDYDFTRIVEIKHVTGQENPYTTIFREYPTAPSSTNDYYYPMLTDKNINLYRKYFSLAEKEKDVIFLGRLAEYKYYNMDQIVARTLMIYETCIKQPPLTIL